MIKRLDGYQRLHFDTLKLLFSKIDISITVKQVEAKYANSLKRQTTLPSKLNASGFAVHVLRSHTLVEKAL